MLGVWGGGPSCSRAAGSAMGADAVCDAGAARRAFAIFAQTEQRPGAGRSGGSAGGRVLARNFQGGVSVIMWPPGEGGETITVASSADGGGRSGRPARKGAERLCLWGRSAREVARSRAFSPGEDHGGEDGLRLLQ